MTDAKKYTPSEQIRVDAIRREVLLDKLREAGQTLSIVADLQEDEGVKKKMTVLSGAVAEAYELLSPVEIKAVNNAN